MPFLLIMSEKPSKAVNKSAATGPQNQPEKPESDKAFLERNNVKSCLNNLLDSLYHHQPDDPINYIAN